jgi:hypothetical protein
MYRISINNYVYIGHTTNFTQRKNSHKSRCINAHNKCHNFLLYKSIRENGGWENCEMVPIEEYECDTVVQARIREEHHRQEYNAELNARKAYSTKQEYFDNHREENKQRSKNWYANNIDRVREYRTQKIVCECGATVNKAGYSNHCKTLKHLSKKIQCNSININEPLD